LSDEDVIHANTDILWTENVTSTNFDDKYWSWSNDVLFGTPKLITYG